MPNKLKKILYSGGGTAGSVTPLLGVEYELRNLKIKHKALLIGTNYGPEKSMAEKSKIKFKAISSGKLRRYISLKNFIDPFKIIFGFFESLWIVYKFKPDVFISAGAFVAIPVALSCKILQIPIIIHQQDARPGLSNKLIAPIADKITLTLKKSLNDYTKNSVVTGNSVRKFNVTQYKSKINHTKKYFGFNNNLPVILIIGGGTGALEINKLVKENINKLCKKYNIIHSYGKNKNMFLNSSDQKNYSGHVFLEKNELEMAYAVSNIVISRAGMGALSELALLKKPSIVIPMPNSHQEENIKILKENKAAIILEQKNINNAIFNEKIINLLDNHELQFKLAKNINNTIKTNGAKKITKIILDTINK